MPNRLRIICRSGGQCCSVKHLFVAVFNEFLDEKWKRLNIDDSLHDNIATACVWITSCNIDYVMITRLMICFFAIHRFMILHSKYKTACVQNCVSICLLKVVKKGQETFNWKKVAGADNKLNRFNTLQRTTALDFSLKDPLIMFFQQKEIDEQKKIHV